MINSNLKINFMTEDEVMKYLMETKKDNVNHPKHYTTNIPIIKIKCECGKVLEIPVECIDVIRNMPTWKGSAIKYLWREGLKTEEGMTDKEKEIEDLNKAIWYIKDRIKQLENNKTRIQLVSHRKRGLTRPQN